LAQIKIALDELRSFIEQNQELMDKMDDKVRLSVANQKIKIGIVPLNALTVSLLKPSILNFLIRKRGGIKGVMIQNLTLKDNHIYIELLCQSPGELEIASSEEK
jgi:hypothetical protein